MEEAVTARQQARIELSALIGDYEAMLPNPTQQGKSRRQAYEVLTW